MTTAPAAQSSGPLPDRLPERLSDASADAGADLLAQLRTLVPHAFSEGRVDFGKLKAALGGGVDEGRERYGLAWAGKADAFRNVQTPSVGTLAPQTSESVNWDATENLIIEGDNLEVLKLLQRPYHGKVKMIYIDPPYNTGNEFIYPDNFREGLADYLRYSGQTGEDGAAQSANRDTSGRYHSNWLNMMYPRLFLARTLLRDDGVIFVSIDDHEVHNLRHLMDEVFGEENFVAALIWEKGRKNDAKLFSVGHEYMLVFARSMATLKERQTIWREEKPGAREIWDEYVRLRNLHNKDDSLIERDLAAWYAGLPKSAPAKKWSRYRRVDKNGPWRDRDISWPGGGGPRYDVVHPKTMQPCKVPERGWIYANSDEMQRQIRLGLVVFRDDHTEPPFRKAHIRPIDDELHADVEDDGDDAEFATQVRGSYFYKQSQVSVKALRQLLDGKFFDNPKDHDEIGRLVEYVVSADDDAIVLDFFAGSGTTAQAVLELNAKDGGHRKFILVQLPEKTDKPDYPTIADITRERVRRVIARLKAAEAEKTAAPAQAALELPPLQGEGGGGDGVQVPSTNIEPNPIPHLASPLKGEGQDLGFRAFKLTASNFRVWDTTAAADPARLPEQIRLHADHVIGPHDGATPLDAALLYELILRAGLPVSARVERVSTPHGAAFAVNGDELLVCVEAQVSLALMRALVARRPRRIVCLDRAFAGDDAAKTNALLEAEAANVKFQTA